MSFSALQSCLIDFTPDDIPETISSSTVSLLVERAIIEGSGGIENIVMTEAGLRFVRHLLSLLPKSNSSCSILPNFKNRDSIRALATLFIQKSKNPEQALETMYRLMYTS